jgi:ribosomal protein S26
MTASMESNHESKQVARKPELARCEQCGEVLPRERTIGPMRVRRCADCLFEFACTD